MKKKGLIRIGISNVVVPGNKTTFPEKYQATSRLHYYASLFNTVEINQCFYKNPLGNTYEKWSNDVPADFQFSLKLSKEVTHTKNLTGDLSCIRSFMGPAVRIGKKKGCILIQFPGKITLDHFEKVEEILNVLDEEDPAGNWRKAIEFRDKSWYVGETKDLVNEHKATVVLHDFKKGGLEDIMGKAKFIYQRFHGPAGDYRGSYTTEFLRTKAEEMKRWTKEGRDVYVYFNNTMGDAFENAKTLQSLINV